MPKLELPTRAFASRRTLQTAFEFFQKESLSSICLPKLFLVGKPPRLIFLWKIPSNECRHLCMESPPG